MNASRVLSDVVREGAGSERVSHVSFDRTVTALYGEQFEKLFRFLDRMSGEPELAADLAQEAFIRLHRRGSVPDNPGAWLASVAMNLFRNVRRSQTRRRRIMTLALGEAVHSDPATAPDDMSEAHERRVQVRHTMSKLSERDGRLLLLRASGFTYHEIAAILDLNESSVGTLLARARRSFKQAYEVLFDAP